VIELNGLYEVLNGDSLVEAVEPFRIILCDKRRGEPVDLLHEMLIMLCVRVGYEGAGSNVAFRKHLKGGICNDLEGHDVIAVGRDRRRIEAVLAFGDLNSAVIDHLPIMLQNIFHCLRWMNPVVDGRLGQTRHHVLLEPSIEHGDGSGRPLDRICLVAAGEN